MLMVSTKQRMHVWSACLTLMFLVGCGGGGGGSSAAQPAAPAPAPPEATVNISGEVMLGPVKNLEIRISGDGSFDPVTGLTDEFGAFGPLAIAESYTGPLRFDAVPGAGSAFVCDAPSGCLTADGLQMAFGDDVPLTASLQLYLADASQALDGVSITPFSTAAAARADALGTFGSSVVQQANDEMDAQLQALIAVLRDSGGVQMSLPFYRYQLWDLTNSSIPEALVGQERVELLLALLGASLFSAGESLTSSAELSAEAFLSQFSAGFAPAGRLPLASADAAVMSLEKLSSGVFSSSRAMERGRGNSGVVLGALAPLDPYALSDSVFATIADTDRIVNTEPAFLFVGDEQLGGTPSASVPLALELGATLNPESLSVRSDDPRIVVSIGQGVLGAVLDMSLDPAAIETPLSERSGFRVVVSSSDDNVRSLFLEVEASFVIAGLRARSGGDYSGFERDQIALAGNTNQPQIPASFAWRQVSGPVVEIQGADQAAPVISLPDLDADADLVMELTVTNRFGASDTTQTTISVQSYADIAGVTVGDNRLNECIADLAASTTFEDVGAVLALDCNGRNIKSMAGIGELRQLQSLDLSELDFLGDLQPLHALSELRDLDVSGQRFLLCTQVEALRLVNPDLAITGGDVCKQQVSLELLGEGRDTQLDSANERLFVSVPERREILVVSTATFRVVDRIAAPGKPRGISLSLDGTRLFAALGDANAILVVELSNLSTQVISLGQLAGGPDTVDVVEVEQDRLFVTTGDANRSSYVVQIRLDAANEVSRIASDQTGRWQPIVLASPTGDFAYLLDSSVYKLDLADATAPVVARESNIGTYNNEAVISADGSRLALSTGEVLRTGSLIEDSNRDNEGAVAVGQAADLYYVAEGAAFYSTGNLRIHRFDRASQVTTIPTECAAQGGATRALSVFGVEDSSFAWIIGDRLCGIASVDANLVDAVPSLRVQDPVLEACVRSAAAAAGVVEAAMLTDLDCSGRNGIKSLVGLERFLGLVSLTLDGSEVKDIRPIEALNGLESIAIRNDSKLSDLKGMEGYALSEADFTGSARVPCAQLQLLRDSRVAVVSDECLTIDRFELNGLGHAVIQNLAGTSLYVSVPSTKTIFELDAATLVERRRIVLTEAPTGLSLSPDQLTLAAALTGVGAVALIDLATEATEVISVQPELDNLLTWDVVFLSEQRLVVTGNPYSSGLSYIVEIRRDLGNRLVRVADNNVIRAGPELLASADGANLYIGSGFSPNSLYKLDALQDSLPILLEDNHGSVSGTQSLAIAPDGSRLLTRQGQRLLTSNFSQTGLYESTGVPFYVSSNLVGFIEDFGASFSNSAAVVATYQAHTLNPSTRRYTGCPVEQPFDHRVEALVTSNDSLVILSSDLVCLLPNISQ